MISVVITAHHDEEGCFLTYWAARQQLGTVNAEYVIVADGGTEIKWEKNPSTQCLRGVFGSPQASRDAGIRMCQHPDVIVLESHVILSDMARLVFERQRMGAALMFPIRVGEGPEQFTVYAHETDWENNLWHKRLIYDDPFGGMMRPVVQFGNSAFALDREWYLQSGGYTNLMTDWAGEEPFIALKAWMLGRECWQTPNIMHAHYLTAGAHAAGVNKRNFQLLRYLIAGERRDGFHETVAEAEERYRICQGPFGGDINRLREHLREIEAIGA